MENIALIGQYCEKRVLWMNTKYDFEFTSDVIVKDVVRLTNQLWKLIPMKEHEENWQKQLDTVIVEIAGLGQIFCNDPQLLQILSKLEGLKECEEIEFTLYRKTIFEVINLLQDFKNVAVK